MWYKTEFNILPSNLVVIHCFMNAADAKSRVTFITIHPPETSTQS